MTRDTDDFEDLWDRARAGDTDARLALEDHPLARGALEAAPIFEARSVARSGDDALVARLVAGAANPVALTPARPRWLSFGRVLVLVSVGSGVAALALRDDGETAPREVSTAPAKIQADVVEPVDPPTATTEVEPLAPAPAPVPTVAPPLATAAPTDHASAKKSGPSARELLAAANKARTAGEVARAIGYYQRLRRDHRGSPEELTSRVAWGRLELDRRNAPAAALKLFDSYLRSRPKGSLVEEALVGKAKALAALGRARHEATAWRTLVERFPNSMSVHRAKRRLAQLEGEG